jgi:hypothetical protein
MTIPVDLAAERDRLKAEIATLVEAYLAERPDVAAQYADALAAGAPPSLPDVEPTGDGELDDGSGAEPDGELGDVSDDEIVARMRAVTVAALTLLLTENPDAAAGLPATEVVAAAAAAVDGVLADLVAS